MKEQLLNITYTVCTEEELTAADRSLVQAAKNACSTSYAPYSNFRVGAAVLLENGETISGSNQENAAYPSGTCAERCTIFYANARYPDIAPTTLAIAACNAEGIFTPSPIPPCGSCRQVLIETENRYGKPLRLLLYGKSHIYIISSASLLLPIRFDASAL